MFALFQDMPVRRTVVVMPCRRCYYPRHSLGVPKTCHEFPGAVSSRLEAHHVCCTTRSVPPIRINYDRLNLCRRALDSTCCPLSISFPLIYCLARAAINVEVFEIVNINDYDVEGEFEESSTAVIAREYGGVDPIDDDCEGRSCIGILTRVRQLR